MAGGQLNPDWVEKLMGWPDSWTAMDSISHVKICFWLMGFINGQEARKREVLRVLRLGNVQEEIQREIGRPVGIHEAAILLSELCEYSNRPDEARIFMACSETLEEEVRSVRLHKSITSAPHRSEPQEQRARKHTDTMQALSRLLAYHGKAHWESGSWEDATDRVAHGVANRVDRLRAIGNGQVPMAAAAAFTELSGRFED